MKKKITIFCTLICLAGLSACRGNFSKPENGASQQNMNADAKEEGVIQEANSEKETTKNTEQEHPKNMVSPDYIPEGSKTDRNGNIVTPNGDTFNREGQWQVPEGGHVDGQGRIYDKNGKLMGGGATVGSVG